MTSMNDNREFDDYVEHPRYGKQPRLTGLNPDKYQASRLWHTENPVPSTAVLADSQRLKPRSCFSQPGAYFDDRRTCEQCGRKFLFFAEEQKHWYETLGFPIDTRCKRCPPCRKAHRTLLQGLTRLREQYDELARHRKLALVDCYSIAEAAITLVESRVFSLSRQKAECIEGWLTRAARDPNLTAQSERLRERLAKLSLDGRAMPRPMWQAPSVTLHEQ